MKSTRFTLEFSLARNHEIPNNKYKSGHTIENTTGGGRNFTIFQESLFIPQNNAEAYPIILGINIGR